MTNTEPRELIQRLANALHDAADDVEGWGNYASSYFQEKHDLAGNVARIHAVADEARAYLAQPEPEEPTDEELKATYWEAFKDAAPCGADESWLAGLRAVARRPKPPSLKEQALAELDLLKGDANAHGLGFDAPAIRRALEALPDEP